MIKTLLIACPSIFAIILGKQHFFPRSPQIDIRKEVREFQNVPDKNARYTLTVFADLPVQDDVSALIDWLDGYAGHSFIRLTKISGFRCVTKTFGFYPQIPLLGLIYPGNVTGIFRDDASHPFDISHEVEVNQTQFAKILDAIQVQSLEPTYNLQFNNCTDFALEILNHLTPDNPIILSRDYRLNKAYVLSTPGGFYRALQKERYYANQPFSK